MYIDWIIENVQLNLNFSKSYNWKNKRCLVLQYDGRIAYKFCFKN